MEKLAKIINWSAIAILIATVFGMFLSTPEKFSVANSILMLLPTALGLAVIYNNSIRGVIFVALGINGLAAFVALFITIVTVAVGTDSPAVVVLVVTVMWSGPGMINVLNCIRILKNDT